MVNCDPCLTLLLLTAGARWERLAATGGLAVVVLSLSLHFALL